MTSVACNIKFHTIGPKGTYHLLGLSSWMIFIHGDQKKRILAVTPRPFIAAKETDFFWHTSTQVFFFLAVLFLSATLKKRPGILTRREGHHSFRPYNIFWWVKKLQVASYSCTTLETPLSQGIGNKFFKRQG